MANEWSWRQSKSRVEFHKVKCHFDSRASWFPPKLHFAEKLSLPQKNCLPQKSRPQLLGHNDVSLPFAFDGWQRFICGLNEDDGTCNSASFRLRELNEVKAVVGYWQ